MTTHWKLLNLSLRMNRKIVFSLLVLLGGVALLSAQSAQVNFTWQGGSDYLSVKSVYGATTSTPMASFKISGNGNVDLPNWKISAQITNYPVKIGNESFPVKKVSFLSGYTDGDLVPNPVPTPAQIGIPAKIPLKPGNSEVFLVPASNAAIVNQSPNQNDYFYINLYFYLQVEGGNYLRKLTTWSEFDFNMRYTLYDQFDNVMGTLDHTFRIQIAPLSGPPLPELSISFSTDASNAMIELNTLQDYLQGKRVTYANGLALSATADYQVSVHSVSPNFTSEAGNILPLDIVKLQIDGDSGSSVPIPIPAQSTAILQGNSTGGELRHFDISYFTEGGDEKLFNIPTELYSTQLMFEITTR